MHLSRPDQSVIDMFACGSPLTTFTWSAPGYVLFGPFPGAITKLSVPLASVNVMSSDLADPRHDAYAGRSRAVKAMRRGSAATTRAALAAAAVCAV